MLSASKCFANVYEIYQNDVWLVKYDTLNKVRIGFTSAYNFNDFSINIKNGSLINHRGWSKTQAINKSLDANSISYGANIEYWGTKYFSFRLGYNYTEINPTFVSDWHQISIIPDESDLPEVLNQRHVIKPKFEIFSLTPEVLWITPIKIIFFDKIVPLRLGISPSIYFLNDFKYTYYNELENNKGYLFNNNSNYYSETESQITDKKSFIFSANLTASIDIEMFDHINLIPEIVYNLYAADFINEADIKLNTFSISLGISYGFGDKIHKKRLQKLPPCEPGFERNMLSGNCDEIICPPGHKFNYEMNDCDTILCPPRFRLNRATNECDTIICPPKYKYDSQTNDCIEVICGLRQRYNPETNECDTIICPPKYKFNPEINDCEEIICGRGEIWDANENACVPIRCSEGEFYSTILDTCMKDFPKFNIMYSGYQIMFASFKDRAEAEKMLLQLKKHPNMPDLGIREGQDEIDKTIKYRITTGVFKTTKDVSNAKKHIYKEVIEKNTTLNQLYREKKIRLSIEIK
jgi:hypothetical protein